MPVKLKSEDFKKNKSSNSNNPISNAARDLTGSINAFASLLDGFKNAKEKLQGLIKPKQEQQSNPAVPTSTAAPPARAVPNKSTINNPNDTKKQATKIYEMLVKNIDMLKNMSGEQIVKNVKTYKELLIKKIEQTLKE